MATIAETLVVVRGGGDLATGVIQKFHRSGFKVVILETEQPLAIRRTVSLCSAVYEGMYQVEDLTARMITEVAQCEAIWSAGEIPLLIDPLGKSLQKLKPTVLVDAIIAKKNLGTNRQLAPITIALGPGFSAPQDVNVVIETMRGHRLGRLIFAGEALPNTGVPGILGGKSRERVVHSPAAGVVKHVRKIGDQVTAGELIFYVDTTPVYSPLDGTLRGLIQAGLTIPKGLKVADVDPRPREDVDYQTISDKARGLGGAALEAALWGLRNQSVSY
ncbi:selenium-dependent molybdenum cofactor biosynthesis protein YqeB [Candidatus Enterococcus leclercqii]|uniref:selenium-dependent molybdenum cofactor biosynthesis protein YqeB n=1 Tax=Candidatus Enterococcus leclercqii TaxID=1857218 RepID=UPI00137A6AB3|nr:selenium-dependent molybdenum cofactor biosynthesis protein YqeB [Enterococcus sp. CU9D]KAF1290089.1 molybdenum hydroxylase [Enterococcus sp. CU9D]